MTAHDREPIDQAMTDCWRINYGLDNQTPSQAAQWWEEHMSGATSGCVAALGTALAELESLRKDAARWRYWRNYWPALCRMEVARFARLDLTRTYVQSPADMDAVTDAAMEAK